MSQIQRLRLKAGLTQGELAKKLGVSEITVRKWEAKVRTPRTKRLKAIAKVLRCNPAELL
jgi:putative transcriptional regulator